MSILFVRPDSSLAAPLSGSKLHTYKEFRYDSGPWMSSTMKGHSGFTYIVSRMGHEEVREGESFPADVEHRAIADIDARR